MIRLLPLAFLLLGACASAPQPAPPPCALALTPVALTVGDGALDRGFIAGVSLVDADDDGDLDLMATRGYSTLHIAQTRRYDRSMLYLNDGHGQFTHDLESALSNADDPASGSTWGDVDGDGDADAFVSTQHGRPDRFYRNQGSGRLTREDLGDATTTPGSNFASSFVDIDGDGDLDLLSGGPTLEPGAPMLIYRNDAGAFVRVTDTPLDNGAANGGAILWADFDNDGDQDLFVANSDIQRRSDMAPAPIESPQLYRNDGAWRFVRTEGQSFGDIAYAAVSAAVADIDNDGDLDLFVGAYTGHDHIFLNNGRATFTLDPRFEGPEHAEFSTSAAFVDFDADGDLDLVSTAYNDAIRLFANDGAGAFAPADAPALIARINTYSSSAAGDLDGDGDLDLALGNWGETDGGEFITILRNDSIPCGSPARLRLFDRHGARDPLGARVTLVTRGPQGERRQLREAAGQSTFRGQSADPFVFATPKGERILRAEIRWPDATTQIVHNLDGAEVIEIRQP